MIKNINNLFSNLSLLHNKWSLKDFDEREALTLSQRNKISPILAKLLTLRNIKSENIKNYLHLNLYDNLPNPFLLKDMEITIDRIIKAIIKNESIGIIADYDVDGSTSAAILIKFFEFFPNKLYLKIPDRLNEGYGPNIRIMDYFIKEKIKLVFTLDCGTSSYGIVDNKKYKDLDGAGILLAACPDKSALIYLKKLAANYNYSLETLSTKVPHEN